MLSKRSLRPSLLWGLAPLIFLSVFYFLPLSRIFWFSFVQGSAAEFGLNLDFSYWGRIMGFTIRQAAISTAATVVVGLPLAWWVHQASGQGKQWMLGFLTVPFVMPAVVVGTAFTALVGPNGFLNQALIGLFGLEQPPINLLHSFLLVIIAHLFYNVSVIVRIVSGFWDLLDSRLSNAAVSLGAGPWVRLWTVELPLIMPVLLSAALLVFLFCFSSFGVVLILGGLEFTTLEVEIYRQTVSFFNLRTAAALSLLQMFITFIVMHLHTRLQSKGARPRVLGAMPIGERPLRRFRVTRILLSMSAWGTVSLLLLPLVALVLRSLTLGEGYVTFQHFGNLFSNDRNNAFLASPLAAMGNSFKYGVVTAFVSVSLGLCMAYAVHLAPTRLSRWLDPFFLLPLGTSTVTLGLGYILAMGPLRTSPWLVPMAHSLIALPFVLRIVLPTLRGLVPELKEVSAVLGAGPLSSWWLIELPLLVPALAVALAFGFLTSVGEFGATLLVARPQYPTIPLMIYRALGQPGLANLGQALALSTILMAMSAVSLLLIDRLPRVSRGF